MSADKGVEFSEAASLAAIQRQPCSVADLLRLQPGAMRPTARVLWDWDWAL